MFNTCSESLLLLYQIPSRGSLSKCQSLLRKNSTLYKCHWGQSGWYRSRVIVFLCRFVQRALSTSLYITVYVLNYGVLAMSILESFWWLVHKRFNMHSQMWCRSSVNLMDESSIRTTWVSTRCMPPDRFSVLVLSMFFGLIAFRRIKNYIGASIFYSGWIQIRKSDFKHRVPQ